MPGTESQRAFDILKKDFARKGDTGDVVVRVKGAGDINSPEVRAQFETVVGELRKQPHVVSITTPYDPGGQRFRSPKDPKIARAEILFDVQSNDVPLKVGSAMRSIAKRANSPILQVELAGSMFTDRITRLDPKSGQMTDYLLPRSTNIRRVFVDNSTTPVTFWVGNDHGASIIKLEPLD